MEFGLRFDFRNPAAARTATADRYAAALEMAEWADGLGCLSIAVSEHHGSADGYLPSPIPMVAAMAARTAGVRFFIAALIAPFHDPLRLAEDMIALDNLSRGRVDVVVAGGYVREEFALFDVPMDERGRRVTEAVAVLRASFAGQPFDYRGRTVHITPVPYRPGGPGIFLGGSSKPAAQRAARIADGFLPSVPEVWEYYREEVQRLGRPDPGLCPIGPNQVVALAEDPDRGWEEMAPYFLHENNAYGVWQAQADTASPFQSVADIEELRSTGQYRVLTPEEYVSELKATPSPYVVLHPMCGGIPVELAWSSVRLFESDVLPAFR
ncbi:MAG: LLM class flavin-dependent oxidoreductase [Acidimicrobiales bacterium]|jgi:alkanesulfonate monooxygenase SsuD/methylene tetrahydromethanopterin reductase-like flavin-dependent oxidoreductase (luciferase family)